MRVLHLSLAPSPADAALTAARSALVVDSMRSMGHEVAAFAPSPPRPAPVDPLAGAWAARRAAQSWLQGREADVVVFTGLWEGVAALAWARSAGARTLWDVAGFPSIDLVARHPEILRRPGRIEQLIVEERSLLEGADRLLAPSRTATLQLLRAGVGEDRVSTVPDAVDAERFHPLPVPVASSNTRGSGSRRGRSTTGSGRPKSGSGRSHTGTGRSTTGSGRPRTGSTTSGRNREALRLVCRAERLPPAGLVPLLQAMATTPVRQRPELHVVAPASAGWRAQLRSLARRLGVEPRVHVSTLRDASGLVPLMHSVHACVAPLTELVAGGTPARYPHEILEAMSVGLPIVSTRIAIVQELVEHGVSAHLVDPGSAAALAEGLAWVSGHPYERAALGARARAAALAEFTPARFRAHLADALERTTAGVVPRSASAT